VGSLFDGGGGSKKRSPKNFERGGAEILAVLFRAMAVPAAKILSNLLGKMEPAIFWRGSLTR
jgi:hypothetical protein